MKVWTNVLIQMAAVGVNAALASLGSMPPDDTAGAVAVVSAAQALTALWAHYRNPDGTPARVGWTPAPPPAKRKR